MAVSIMERRWGAQRPVLVAQALNEWEPNSAVWGRDYPREYESYLRTRITDTKTKYGGSYPRDYLEGDPRQVILFAADPTFRRSLRALERLLLNAVVLGPGLGTARTAPW